MRRVVRAWLRRAGSEVIAEQVVAAVNAALDDLAAKVAEAAPAPAADPAQLMHRLREVQVESVQRLETFLRAINDAARRG